VSNSSSTSFLITNISEYDIEVDLVQFVEETIDLIDGFNKEYNAKITWLEVLKTATDRNITWQPNEKKVVEFGDHAGPWADTALGRIFDNMLRDGGKSKNFEWKFLEMNR